jgi:hypothetical protein
VAPSSHEVARTPEARDRSRHVSEGEVDEDRMPVDVDSGEPISNGTSYSFLLTVMFY